MSVMPPSSTRHFGLSPAVPFKRDPLPAARMMPFMVSGRRNQPMAAAHDRHELRDVLAAVPAADGEDEQTEVERNTDSSLGDDCQERTGGPLLDRIETERRHG